MNRKKPVICVETGQVFDSVKAAAASIHFHPNGISMVLRGKSKTAGGYHWEYADEESLTRETERPAARPKMTIVEVQTEARRRTEETGRYTDYADIQKEETLRMVRRQAGLERLKRQRRAKE